MQAEGCGALSNVCFGSDAAGLAREQQAAEAGALEVVVAALRAHQQVAAVQKDGCRALINVCGGGTDAAGLARRRRAAQAGGRAVAAAAMQAHPGDSELQWCGQLVLTCLAE